MTTIPKKRLISGIRGHSRTPRYERLPDGSHKRTQDTVNAQGQASRSEVTFKVDGKDYPVQGGTTASTETWRQVDARTIESVSTLNGKVVVTTRRVLSADGQSVVTTQTGTNAQGQAVNNTIYTFKQ